VLLSELGFKQLIREEINKIVMSEAPAEPKEDKKITSIEDIPALKPARALAKHIASNMDQRAWQKTIPEIDSRVLAIAMSSWRAEDRKQVLGWMSPAVRNAIAPELKKYRNLETMSEPQFQDKVIGASDEIWNTIRRFIIEGKLPANFDPKILKWHQIDPDKASTMAKADDWLPKNTKELIKFVTTPKGAGPAKSGGIEFEDLIVLNGREAQLALNQIDSRTLTLALVTASDKWLQHFLQTMSSKAAETIMEALVGQKEAYKKNQLSPADIKAAQQEFLEVVLRLEDEGKLVGGPLLPRIKERSAESESEAAPAEAPAAAGAATAGASSGAGAPTGARTTTTPYMRLQQTLRAMLNQTVQKIKSNLGSLSEKSPKYKWKPRNMSLVLHKGFKELFGQGGTMLQFRPKKGEAAPEAEAAAAAEAGVDPKQLERLSLQLSEKIVDAAADKPSLIIKMFGTASNFSQNEKAALLVLLGEEDAKRVFVVLSDNPAESGMVDMITTAVSGKTAADIPPDDSWNLMAKAMGFFGEKIELVGRGAKAAEERKKKKPRGVHVPDELTQPESAEERDRRIQKSLEEESLTESGFKQMILDEILAMILFEANLPKTPEQEEAEKLFEPSAAAVTAQEKESEEARAAKKAEAGAAEKEEAPEAAAETPSAAPAEKEEPTQAGFDELAADINQALKSLPSDNLLNNPEAKQAVLAFINLMKKTNQSVEELIKVKEKKDKGK